MPECLLTETSKYFIEACDGDWQGSTSCTLRLLDVDNEAFNSYLCWSNRKVLAIDYAKEDGMDATCAMEKLVALWLLADRLVDAKLRNAVTDTIVDVASDFDGEEDQVQVFPPHMTVLIWSTLAKGRALRRLVVDHYVQKVKPAAMEPYWDEVHPDFIKSLAVIGMEWGPSEGEEGGNDQPACPVSRYHEHDNPWLCEEADYEEQSFHY